MSSSSSPTTGGGGGGASPGVTTSPSYPTGYIATPGSGCRYRDVCGAPRASGACQAMSACSGFAEEGYLICAMCVSMRRNALASALSSVLFPFRPGLVTRSLASSKMATADPSASLLSSTSRSRTSLSHPCTHRNCTPLRVRSVQYPVRSLCSSRDASTSFSTRAASSPCMSASSALLSTTGLSLSLCLSLKNEPTWLCPSWCMPPSLVICLVVMYASSSFPELSMWLRSKP